MGQRVHPHLVRERCKFTNKPLSVSYISGQLTSRYTIEDYEIRAIADQIFEKHLRTNICIERISQNVLLIRILTHTSNMLVGEESVLLEKYRGIINKKFGSIYKNIQVGIVNESNIDTDAEQICRNIVRDIESTNGKNYVRNIRFITEQVGKNGLLGIFIVISGRINGGTIASDQKFKAGTIKTQSIKADITKSVHHAKTKTGMMGVQVTLSRIPTVRNSMEEPRKPFVPRDRQQFKPRTGFNKGPSSGFHKGPFKPRFNNNTTTGGAQ